MLLIKASKQTNKRTTRNIFCRPKH